MRILVLALLALIAALFVAAAVAMGLMASTGGEMPASPAAWLLVGGTVLAGLLLAVGPALTFGRRRIGAGLILMPMLVLCSWFSAQSVIKFCREHLLDQAAVRERAGASYAVAARRVADLRQQRDDAGRIESRDAGVIRALVEEKLAEPHAGGGTVASRSRRCQDGPKAAEACAEVWRLEIAAKTAERRDDIDRRLGEAMAALARLRPVAEARPDGAETGPAAGYLGWARRVTGLDISTTEELRAVSFALLIWLGELLMPMVLALMAGREGAGWGTDWGLSGRASRGTPAAETGVSDRALIERWAGERVETGTGTRGTPGGELYRDFCAWARRTGRQEPPAHSLFGVVLARDLGWSKGKAGKQGLIMYGGVRLKPAPGLTVVKAGVTP